MSETTNAAEDTARIRAEFTVEGALASCAWTPRSPVPLTRRAPRTSGWIRDGHVTVTNNGKTVKNRQVSVRRGRGRRNAPAPRDLADIRPERWTASASCTWTRTSLWWTSPQAWRHTLTRLARPHRHLRAHG